MRIDVTVQSTGSQVTVSFRETTVFVLVIVRDFTFYQQGATSMPDNDDANTIATTLNEERRGKQTRDSEFLRVEIFHKYILHM